jgi:hypothetical protein
MQNAGYASVGTFKPHSMTDWHLMMRTDAYFPLINIVLFSDIEQIFRRLTDPECSHERMQRNDEVHHVSYCSINVNFHADIYNCVMIYSPTEGRLLLFEWSLLRGKKRVSTTKGEAECKQDTFFVLFSL